MNEPLLLAHQRPILIPLLMKSLLQKEDSDILNDGVKKTTADTVKTTHDKELWRWSDLKTLLQSQNINWNNNESTDVKQTFKQTTKQHKTEKTNHLCPHCRCNDQSYLLRQRGSLCETEKLRWQITGVASYNQQEDDVSEGFPDYHRLICMLIWTRLYPFSVYFFSFSNKHGSTTVVFSEKSASINTAHMQSSRLIFKTLD